MSSVFSQLWAGLLALLPGGDAGPMVFPGYVEAGYVLVAPQMPGQIVAIHVAEGDVLAAGAPLFDQDDRLEAAALRAAEARVEMARAQFDNLQTGAREPELEVLRASLAQAEADLELASKTLERSQSLSKTNNIALSQLDADKARVAGLTAHVRQLKAQLAVNQLPGRDGDLAASAANLRAAEAEMQRQHILFDQRRITAPVGGRVEKLYYETGEMAGSGPVLSILPEGERFVRFFVPETLRAELTIGQDLPVTCSACAPGLVARLRRIASQPEFTPPIIYSRDQRGRLVFLAEADLPQSLQLLPGQPVSIGPLP